MHFFCRQAVLLVLTSVLALGANAEPYREAGNGAGTLEQLVAQTARLAEEFIPLAEINNRPSIRQRRAQQFGHALFVKSDGLPPKLDAGMGARVFAADADQRHVQLGR